MTFTVLVTEQAERNLKEIGDWIAQASPDGAARWTEAAWQAIHALERRADVCPVAPERRFVDRDVRSIIFKTRRGRKYRAVFYIEGSTVVVTHVRGPGQNLISPDEFDRF